MIICEAFNCDPKRAQQLDWYTVRRVLNARAARAAFEAAARNELGNSPDLHRIYSRMVSAQKDDSSPGALDQLIDALERDTQSSGGA